MQYNDKTNEYLKGITFSNGATIKLAVNKSTSYRRDDYLVDIVRNKNILHLGFVDHLPLIDEKIQRGEWLHQKLTEVSNLCYGIDINYDGIKYIQEKYKYDNLYVLDVVSDSLPEEILDTQFDYIVIPDVIEHIGNPVSFLESIRTKFGVNTNNIILTTPNGFRLNNIINTFKNKEIINTDHRFWFTPYTLSKIMIDAGYEIKNLGYFQHGKYIKRYFMRNTLLSKFHVLKDTLIIEATLK